MLRLLIVIVFVCLGTLTGIWAGNVFAGDPENKIAVEGELPGPHETAYLTPEIFVLPIVTSSEVNGFLVTRFAFGTNNSEANNTGVDDETILRDIFYDVAFNSAVYRPGETRVPDASAVADALLAKGNDFVGVQRFTSVLIQQVDFFNRSEVRRKVVEERSLPD
jgi:hypothetical protein